MEYYSAIKNNEFMNFLGKWMNWKYYPKRGNAITKEYTWNAIIDRWILISPEALNTEDTTSNQMIPMKKEEEGPNPGKAWSSIVGEYQDQEKGGGKIGEWMERRGLMGHMGRGELGKGKAIGM